MIFKISSSLTITTSRKPSQITRRFAQFIKHYFNAVYINRGKTSFKKIINQITKGKNSKLIVITETKGNPSNIDVYDIDKDTENPQYSIFLNVSLPKSNSNINVNSNEIVVINKAKSLKDINMLFEPFKTYDKIKTNCIIIKSNNEKDNIAGVTFVDKKGSETKYKIYIKGYKINK